MIAFFTVCGGGEDYDFLFGSLRHHAELGGHLVLDVSPEPRRFLGLPPSVRWATAPLYGSGSWGTFRMATALERARQLALDAFPGAHFLVQLDCDEYFAPGLRELLVRQDTNELPRVFLFDTIHWRGGAALRFGESEVHLRAWDVRADVFVQRNLSWVVSPHYNGNPEHHPILTPRALHETVRVARPTHYHLHYAVGAKRGDDETARTTIDGWPVGTPVEAPCPWPEPVRRWSETGIRPSKDPTLRFLP